MNEPNSRPGGGNRASRPRENDATGKVFPPDSPVDVPNLPRPPKNGAPDEARDSGQPREDAQTDSSWADNTKPAPNKKNVRDHNIF
ncbi:hypothetical protein CAL14_13305 [Bordetella genomosp. 9]|uniref:hypothetical protein n=1 Tax=Bordetella genomosp. 9 TaxID=1416803 RepID=UPI000A28E01A|nr:hypothetical protein [Bordetella genomosp. 9]ARP91147.1 hypothetical protein CAL14_13305 [Bordetella genomosp. 9]